MSSQTPVKTFCDPVNIEYRLLAAKTSVLGAWMRVDSQYEVEELVVCSTSEPPGIAC